MALSRVTEVGEVEDLGIPLLTDGRSKGAPPPAPPIGVPYASRQRQITGEDAPGQPQIVSTMDNQMTICWRRSGLEGILGYHVSYFILVERPPRDVIRFRNMVLDNRTQLEHETIMDE